MALKRLDLEEEILEHNSWKAPVHAPHPGISSLASAPHAPEIATRVVGVDSLKL